MASSPMFNDLKRDLSRMVMEEQMRSEEDSEQRRSHGFETPVSGGDMKSVFDRSFSI